MALIDQTFVKKNVSFTLYPAAIKGNNYVNVQILAILDSDTATGLDQFDPVAQHIAVYPSLPPENAVPNDPTSYLYVRIKHQGGATEILGLPWIVESSVVEQVTGTLRVDIFNVNPVLDRERIIELLRAGNFHQIEVKTLTP